MMIKYIWRKFRGVFFFICCFNFIMCSSSCNKKNNLKTIQPYANNLGIKPSIIAQFDTIHFTQIEWVKPIKYFGTVNEGDKILIKFAYKNTGIHPLFISKAMPSCGCTNPTYSEQPIMPGETGEVSVNFDSNGQLNHIKKSIVITSNTTNSVQHRLSFEGNVFKRNANFHSKK